MPRDFMSKLRTSGVVPTVIPNQKYSNVPEFDYQRLRIYCSYTVSFLRPWNIHLVRRGQVISKATEKSGDLKGQTISGDLKGHGEVWYSQRPGEVRWSRRPRLWTSVANSPITIMTAKVRYMTHAERNADARRAQCWRTPSRHRSNI
jgi:hypothetical protein